MISDRWSQHRAMYDLHGVYMFQIHCLLTACTIHIVNLPAIAATNHFTKACNTLQDLSGRSAWAGSSLTILRGLVETWKLILPQEAEDALYRNTPNERPQNVDLNGRGQSIGESLAQMSAPPESEQQGSDPGLVYPLSNREQADGGDRKIKVENRGNADNAETYATHPPKRPGDSPGNSREQRPSQRQRLRSPKQPAQTVQAQAQQAQQLQQQHRMADYLYSPVAIQKGPMLVPVGRGKSTKDQRAGAAQVLTDGVEGMQFRDDWRDPHLGFGNAN